MGILKEMFSEGSEEYSKKEPVLLAKGRYKSNSDMILSGYKTFQKKYVVKNLVIKLILVVLAIASSVMMLMSNQQSPMMPAMLLLVCVVIGFYFINEPLNNRKKLKNGLSKLEGTEYEIEITDQTIKISTVEFPVQENAVPEIDNVENTSEAISEEQDLEDNEEDEIPATIIHLDSTIVDFIDREDMFIVCVKKSYVFIIPKTAFSEEEIQATKEKLSSIMGIRFKMVD